MRLIDADAFNDWILSHFAEPQSALILTLQGFIAEQPTAYSVDKVVEELEKSKDKGSVTKTERLITKACVDRAIEIVKQVGASDDVCEWKDGAIGIFNIKTSCGNSIDVNYGYEFCPYCGKKIKVVE